MAKTKRVIKECLSQVDIVLELLDARIPYSSKNPETDKLIGEKPKLTVLTKSTLASQEASLRWAKHYESCGERVVIIDSAT
jgi:ribosome biogenesis GTPase A